MFSKEDQPQLTRKLPLSIVRNKLSNKISENGNTSSNTAAIIIPSTEQPNNFQSSVSSNLPKGFGNNFGTKRLKKYVTKKKKNSVNNIAKDGTNTKLMSTDHNKASSTDGNQIKQMSTGINDYSVSRDKLLGNRHNEKTENNERGLNGNQRMTQTTLIEGEVTLSNSISVYVNASHNYSGLENNRRESSSANIRVIETNESKTINKNSSDDDNKRDSTYKYVSTTTYDRSNRNSSFDIQIEAETTSNENYTDQSSLDINTAMIKDVLPIDNVSKSILNNITYINDNNKVIPKKKKVAERNLRNFENGREYVNIIQTTDKHNLEKVPPEATRITEIGRNVDFIRSHNSKRKNVTTSSHNISKIGPK